jgi:hypothetical protein
MTMELVLFKELGGAKEDAAEVTGDGGSRTRTELLLLLLLLGGLKGPGPWTNHANCPDI